jgi:hypothetical protein
LPQDNERVADVLKLVQKIAMTTQLLQVLTAQEALLWLIAPSINFLMVV